MRFGEIRETKDRPEVNRSGSFSVSHSQFKGLQYLISKTLSKLAKIICNFKNNSSHRQEKQAEHENTCHLNAAR